MIWDALKAASKSDVETAKLITDSAGIIVGPPNLTICYDERGECPMAHMRNSTSLLGTLLQIIIAACAIAA